MCQEYHGWCNRINRIVLISGSIWSNSSGFINVILFSNFPYNCNWMKCVSITYSSDAEPVMMEIHGTEMAGAGNQKKNNYEYRFLCVTAYG